MKNTHADIEIDQIGFSESNKMFRDDADFTKESLGELADSIRKSGVYSPILVRPSKNVPASYKKYELVFGERRVRASQVAGLTIIPAIIREMTDEEALEAQVVENLQRENINPMKEARAFQWMEKTKKLSGKQIADRIGKSADYVQERIRLNSLITDAQQLVSSGTLPIKAALKLSRVPDKMQKECLEEITTTIEGANGKSITFRGMDSMQEWLDYNIFNDLALADFATDDAQLVASAGSCMACTKRTKNSGGLFDDIASKDQCLDSTCFRIKQLAQYAVLRKELEQKFPGITIVYAVRWHLNSSLEQTFKKLQPRMHSYEGTKISQAEAAKSDNKDLRLVILIGPPSSHDKKIERYEWRTMKRSVARSSTPATMTPKQKAEAQKLKDDRLKQNAKSEFEKQVLSEMVISKSKSALKADVLRIVVRMNFTEIGYTNEALPALKALGIDWVMSKEEGKKKGTVTIKAKDADLIMIDQDNKLSFTEENLKQTLKAVSGNELNALFVHSTYASTWHGNRDELQKALGIDEKAINAKATALTAAWWKEEQSKKAPPAAAAKKASGKKVKPKAKAKK